MRPHEQMQRFITGYWISQAVYVAAKLRLADHLKGGPCTAEDLAQKANAHSSSLYRLLRALASLGIFAEDNERRFTMTPLAECLRSDIPDSQWGFALMNGEEQYHAWGDLLGSVRTGETSFDRIFGKPIFEYLAEHPEQAKIFDQAMVGVHGAETEHMLDAYDFTDLKVVADIGGGNGSVIRAVLANHPTLRGILYDLPNVVARAEELIKAEGLKDRCDCFGGSFFENVPSGADAYLLRHIIHDWDDEKSLTILKNIRAAIGENGRLLVIETVVPPGNEPSFAKLLDLTMLLIPGGKERTEEEYRDLYQQAGFELTRIVPTIGDVSIIEGKPV